MRFRLFDRGTEREVASQLYLAVVAQARAPAFYAELGVPDTVDGRFELIALHCYLVLARLKSDPGCKDLAQAVFDAMFDDMDRGLRELGVGDLSVGPHVKRMAKALYGRIVAYDQGLEGDDGVLVEALRRNLYGTLAAAAGPDPAALGAVAAYVRCARAALEGQPIADLTAGQVRFPPPPSRP